MLARRQMHRRSRIHHRENSPVPIVTEWGIKVKECRAKKKAESPDSQQQESSLIECWVCNCKGHKSRDCKKLNEYQDAAFAGIGMDRNVKCFFCNQIGHVIRDCPKKLEKHEKARCSQEGEDDGTNFEYGGAGHVVEIEDKVRSLEVSQPRAKKDENTSNEDMAVSNVVWTRSKGEMPVYRGKVGKQEVQTLRDIGCSCVVVKRKFVEGNQLTGKTRLVIQLLGTITRLPVAKIHVDTPFLESDMEALCVEDSIYDLIIGNVYGAREPGDPDLEWEGGAVETRAQKKNMSVTSLQVEKCQDVGVTAEEYLKLQQGDRS